MAASRARFVAVGSLTLGVALLAIAGPLPVAESQSSTWLVACKKLDVRSGGFVVDMVYSQCGAQFTTSDPYVGLVVHLERVQDRTEIIAELLDPDQAVVWTRRAVYAPEPGYLYPNIWLPAVLPVAADTAAVAAENVRLTPYVIKLEGKSARERVGEWTLRAQVNRTTHTRKFTLRAAP
jgi:hypothetical protein